MSRLTASYIVAFLLPYFTCFENIFSQSTFPIFEHLTTDDGLSSNKVEVILQDHEGFYWMGTQNGLNRYDGTSFKVFRHHEGDSTSLANDYCTDIQEDHHGDIWIATYRGVSRYIKSKGYFQTIYVHHPAKTFEIANWIRKLVIDQEDNVWMSGVAVWKYDRKQDRIILFQHDPDDNKSISDSASISQFVYDHLREGIWMNTEGVLNFLDIRQNEFYHHQNNPYRWKIFDVPANREIGLDHKHHLWFRDRDQRLSCFYPEENKIVPGNKILSEYTHQMYADLQDRWWIWHWAELPEIYDPVTGQTNTHFFKRHHARSPLSERITSVFVDQQHNYWISSSHGINIYNERNQYYQLYALPAEHTGDPAPSIMAISQTKPAELWILTDQGLFQFQLSNEISHKFDIPNLDPHFGALCADGNQLWIGSGQILYGFDLTTFRIIKRIDLHSKIFFLLNDQRGNIWAGLWVAGLYQVNPSTLAKKYFGNENSTLKTNSLVTGLVDDDGLWIGQNGGYGFSKYHFSDQTFSHYHPRQRDTTNIAAGTITCLAKDAQQHLWLGTFGHGIFKFDERQNAYQNFQHDQGLRSNYINSIATDDDGNLWVSTADGMNYLKAGTNQFERLEMDLVFLSNSVVPNSIKGMDGKIYFFCYNQFVQIQPEAYQPAKDFPPVVISHFKILNNEVPFSQAHPDLHLSHRQNFFSFEYSALNPQPHYPVHFQYKLEGFDHDWHEAGENTIANYTNVPGGSYTFKIKVDNAEGKWSEPLLNIPVSVKPPYWLTWWFIVLSVFTIVGIMYGIYQYRLQQFRNIYAIKSKISQDLHDDVGASLSSIHIYSTVAEEALHHHPEKAEKIVQQIKQNSRQVMENMSDIIWAMNTEQPDGETLIGRVKNYGADLLAQKNIECLYTIDALAEKKIQKPETRKNILLIIKEALNNIAKYSDATQAKVSISLNGTDMLVQVADNGKGFDPSFNQAGNGLKNMGQRAVLLGGSIQIQSAEKIGTVIECRIPLAKISDG